MVVFDTEDDSAERMQCGESGFKKKVTQIAAISDSGERFHNRGNVTEFFNWLDKHDETDLWAHNAQYDLGNLCHTGKPCRLDDWEVILVGSRFIRGRWRGFNLADTFNLWPMALKSVGKAFGIEKFEMDVRSKDYVFRDCEIGMAALQHTQRICRSFCLESIPRTLGGLCTQAFMASEGENFYSASANARSALYGGRVELFSQGGSGNILYTDINSLYPFAMAMPLPDDCRRLDSYKKGWGICYATVQVPKCEIAPLPYRTDDGRILYPCGKFSGWWTFHELRNAERFGGSVYRYSDCEGSLTARPYYKRFLFDCYARRIQSQTEAEKLQWKLILNNLYGRLAISGEITRSLLATNENQDSGITYGRRVLCAQQMPLPDFTNYLHAAYVTSYARLILQSFLRRLPFKSLIYCDTDSVIFFWPDDKPPFTLGSKLGRMKLVGIGNKAIPYAPKMYQFDNDYKAKGVPKRLAQEFIETGHAEYELPFKLRESIIFFDRGNSRKLSVWRKVEKFRKTDYDKKRFDKGHYYPIVLSQ